MEKAQVIIERTYNAPVERVWQAITDIRQMKQWYMPMLSSFRPQVGFETDFTVAKNGKDWTHLWKITEMVPNKKISYEWRFEGFPGNSLVTFELTPNGDKTHLVLSHIGLETFEGDKNPGLEPHNFKEGWTQLIGTLLKEFVEKQQVILERTYNASPKQVWKAITDPDQMKQWYLPIEDFRAEVGFETQFDHHALGKVFPHAWKVTEVVPGEKISYEWRYPGFPGNSLVTFELAPDGAGTRITLTHTGLETFGGDNTLGLMPQNFKEGWEYFIGSQLKNFVERVPVS